jgi:hypothetical protein
MRFKRRKALFDSYFCACARVFPKGVGYRMELSALTGRFLIGVAWENAMIAHAQPYVTARVSATLIVLTALALGIVGSLALPSPGKRHRQDIDGGAACASPSRQCSRPEQGLCGTNLALSCRALLDARRGQPGD